MREQLWETVSHTADFAGDPSAWVVARMSEGLPWLLVHADDGVIWGRRQADGTLKVSGDAFSDPQRYPALAVRLRALTVQQLRIFGPDGEILLWREDEGFQGRQILDGASAPENSWEEQQLLWGTPQAQAGGFTLLEEGQQGQIHAVPLAVGNDERAVLTVRHYLGMRDDGQAFAQLSRLVTLGCEKRREK